MPKSANDNLKRQGFILGVLLFAALVLSGVAVVVNQYNVLTMGDDYQGMSPGVLVIAFLLLLALYLFLRIGFVRQTTYILIGFLAVAGTFTLYSWGVDVPQGLLIYALVVIMSGILVGSRFAFILTGVMSLALFGIQYGQDVGVIVPAAYWKENPSAMHDTLVVVVTLAFIMVVSALYSREVEKSLLRARKSEVALKEERDHLEEKVEARTKELKRTQLEKMIHLYSLAEFGKLASGLFHDFLNPLTTVSLNLEELENKGHQERRSAAEIETAVRRAVSGTHQMERFVAAARRQIREQSERRYFSAGDEIQRALDMLEYRVREAKVKLRFERQAEIEMYGDSVKLNKLVMNLASNAIDAAEDLRNESAKREVLVELSREEGFMVLTVQDWGDGIAPENLKKVFEPLFTTKVMGKGTGLGLAICKDILEKEFNGEIVVKSEVGKGTTFTVRLPLEQES